MEELHLILQKSFKRGTKTWMELAICPSLPNMQYSKARTVLPKIIKPDIRPHAAS